MGNADLGNKIKTETQKLIKKFNVDVPGLKKVVDNKLFKPFEKVLETRPAKFARKFAFPLIVGGVVAKYYLDKAKINNTYKQVKNELEQDRADSRVKIAKNNFNNLGTIKETNQIFILPFEKQSRI